MAAESSLCSWVQAVLSLHLVLYLPRSRGLSLDEARISSLESRVDLWVIPVDEVSILTEGAIGAMNSYRTLLPWDEIGGKR